MRKSPFFTSKLTRKQVKSILGGIDTGEAAIAICSADCGGGVTLTCKGENCSAQDYKHCSWTVNGNSYTKKCPIVFA